MGKKTDTVAVKVNNDNNNSNNNNNNNNNNNRKVSRLGKRVTEDMDVKVRIIPLVVGSLGAIPKQFGNRLKQIGITARTAQV